MEERISAGSVVGIIAVALLLLFGGMFGCPMYNVWTAGKAGEAQLHQAESNRQIAVLEAKAKQESAKMLAEAEVLRAEGVARANKIIGESLRGNEGYLHYLWVSHLIEGGNHGQTVVYVPTDGQFPIMESTRLQKLLPTIPAAPSAAEKRN